MFPARDSYAAWAGLLSLALAVGLVGIGWGAASGQTTRSPYRRAVPPPLDASATADIFFDDVFTQGVVGQRPQSLGTPATTGVPDATSVGSAKAKPGKSQAKKPRRKRQAAH